MPATTTVTMSSTSDEFQSTGINEENLEESPEESLEESLEESRDMTAKEWFRRNAKFRVPPYRPPSQSRSSSELQTAKLDRISNKLPRFAFFDERKADRFIDALDDALGDMELQAGVDIILPMTTVEEIYSRLFHPEVEKKDGITLVEWIKVTSEFDVSFVSLIAGHRSLCFLRAIVSPTMP